MKQKECALLSWSGGKDSSLCLFELQNNQVYKDFEVRSLLTTLTQDYNRISMHGVRKELLQAQAESIGIPVEEVWIPSKASNEIYQEQMAKSLSITKQNANVSYIIFGDLFLEDIRAYRERFLQEIGFECIFPLWGEDTNDLARYFIESGFRAIICTVDPTKLDPKFCGREIDKNFLSEIPKTVDPCGERGEFHTFVYDGPIFKTRLNVKTGSILEREGFYFADMLVA